MRLKKCWYCKQPINFKRWQIWMTPPVMYQHGSNTKWYNPLDECMTNPLLKSINWVIAILRGYKANSYHGFNRDTGELI